LGITLLPTDIDYSRIRSDPVDEARNPDVR
jgi:hypothetical protein